MARLREIWEELQQVFAGQGGAILDASLPLLGFLTGRALCCTEMGLRLALLAAALMILIRLMRQENLLAALSGLGLGLVAALLAWLSSNVGIFLLPGLLSGAVTTGVCVISLAIARPLAAWASYLTRRWPLDWYWHPQVKPAYRNVTILWAVVFLIRLGIQYSLFKRGAVDALATAQLLMGWPLIIVLLIASYLYGSWQLKQLGGPSVDEFKEEASPPWQSQQRGF